MASDDRMGYMAVVAVSCGMALVALQLHKRLTSEFMKKVELSIGMHHFFLRIALGSALSVFHFRIL